MSAYGFLLPCSNTIIIAGDDEHVGKVTGLDNKDSKVIVYKDIKSLMNDDWHSYATYQMSFTVKNGLVDKVSVSNTSEELLDHDEYNHESLMSIARFIGWYEILPPIIGKMR
ncbi:hypothetical protein Tco_0454364 [Tanacetum coccineum]